MPNPSGKMSRRWAISLRLLMFGIALLAVWLGRETNRARAQRKAIATIQRARGFVVYDYQRTNAYPIGWDPIAEPPAPAWLRRHLGEDYFREAIFVYLSSSAVSDETLKSLSTLGRLERLVLVSDRLNESGLVHFKGLRRLRSLDLADTPVGDAGLAHLAGLSNLRELGLFGTRISDAGLIHLEGLDQLQQLNLQDTRITDAGLAHLKGLRHLKTLHASGSRISEAGIAELKRAIPGLTVD